MERNYAPSSITALQWDSEDRVSFPTNPDTYIRPIQSIPEWKPTTIPKHGCAPSTRSGSAMAPVSIHQLFDALQNPPILYDPNAHHPTTETSISTRLTSLFSGVPLLEDSNEVIIARPKPKRQPGHECTFWFLACPYVSIDFEEWKTHCLSHFRGEEPPKSVQCPLCDDFKLTADNGWVSWDYRQDHLADHCLGGQSLRSGRPDFHLFQHMWQTRLIDDRDLKELKGGNHYLPRPLNKFKIPERYARRCISASRRRHQHVAADRK
ncbi:hypothetical protein K491DRAFT_746400, partial [Lophiostoma macrostomum CBS 122681]